MRAGLCLSLGLSMAVLGCGWGDADTSQNPRPRGPVDPLGAPAQPNVNLSTSGPVAQAQPGEALKAPPPKPLEPAAAEPEKEKRDLSRELRAAVGMPTDCLHPRLGTDAPAKVVVDLEAHFVEAGLATRAYARSSQLDAEELECIKKRLSGVRLQAPLEESPRAVSATLEFTFAAPKPP